MTTFTVRFRVAGHEAADWAASNPVLLARELGVETDTLKMKMGDGTTAWNSLDYFGGGALADGSVTNAKLADMGEGSIKGRAAGAGDGPPVNLNVTQVFALLGGSTGTDAIVRKTDPDLTSGTVLANAMRLAGNSFLRVEGSGSSPPSGSTGPGFNIFAAGGEGWLEAYNYTGSAYIPVNFNGSRLNFKVAGNTVFSVAGALGNYADDTAAASGGVPVGGLYRNGSAVMIRVS